MRNLLIINAIILSLLFLPLTAFAVNFPPKPADNVYYVDQANIITTQDKAQINQLAQKLWEEKRIPLLVVTIPSLAQEGAIGGTVESYARMLFDYWGIGSQAQNNGILLLVSISDRHARIEFGESWAHRYDSQAKDIMQSAIIPFFKAGNYSAGILSGVHDLDQLARGEYTPPPLPLWVIVTAIISVLLMIAVIYSLFKSGRSGWGWAVIAALGILLVLLLRAASKMGRFSGGSSGGGGASGSW